MVHPSGHLGVRGRYKSVSSGMGENFAGKIHGWKGWKRLIEQILDSGKDALDSSLSTAEGMRANKFSRLLGQPSPQ